MSKVSSTFKINGTNMPEPKYGGIGVTDEPVWSSNTGRSSTGKMIGDIVAWKTTVEVAWPPLTYAHAKLLRDAIRNAGEFFTITYPDVASGSTVANMPTTKTVYAGNVPRALLSLSSAYPRYEGITVTFIEQ